MNKSELYTGARIVTRSGEVYIVQLVDSRTSIAVNSKGWLDLDSYNEDLSFIETEEDRFDIIKVYDYQRMDRKSIMDLTQLGKLLWESQDIPEYTMEELADLIGHDFKIKK